MTDDSTALTRKVEAFCLAVFAGQNPSKAYREAYKPKRAKTKTIHEMASRLMAKRKVGRAHAASHSTSTNETGGLA